MGDATLIVLLGAGLLVVGQWFLFVTADRWETDEFSRGLRTVAKPLRWAGLVVLSVGLAVGLVTLLW